MADKTYVFSGKTILEYPSRHYIEVGPEIFSQ